MKFNIQVELYKGDEPVTTQLTTEDDLTQEQALYGTQLAFDKGEADKVALYISRDDELVTILTFKKDAFDVKDASVEINAIENPLED